ncbi:cell division protein FtsI/penicillin-binding protein 2 [Peribacillus deserti]|uniref:Cell division protein FtsI/penicillin-binding protein 2 n=1 Tax=Peribacillus deserti TaxID=673318 RepID=A0ABS2QFQ0_9BACI|nr:penicillin-binding transpeptidase domain-containing protein [Peribacillus deserti]MBM7691860.1 cell division protein FtsI/penicillin-binding protein 2 [Peribacillus deserti]
MILLFALIGRLVQIQLVSSESFTKHHINLIQSSVNQRTQVLSIDSGRGKFYDRNGEPLGHEEVPALVLFPFLKGMDWPSKKVAQAAGISESDLLSAVNKAQKPFAYGGKTPLYLTDTQMDEINSLKIPGVFAISQSVAKKMPAEQLIGTLTKWESRKKQLYPRQNLSPEAHVGNTGLQAAFDEFLLSEGESKLVFHVDGIGGPLFGVDVKYVEPANPLYPVRVITTLDKELQAAAEDLTDKLQIHNGGLLLLNIETSEIRALVSRPAIHKKNPNIGSENNMFSQAKLGSVFKTVIAAAAIDYQLVKPGQVFDCNVTINGAIDEKRRLGTLDFEESFAQSCNRTFGDLAIQLTQINPDILENYARKLNIIGPSGWQGQVFHSEIKQLFNEEQGKVWDQNTDKKDKRLAAHTGIGQQDVQVTPLAAANMMATIARGGESRMVKAVSKVTFKNGSTVVEFPNKKLDSDSISPYTAMKLQTMLRKVVIEEKGTGRVFQGLPYEVAGKSGTAQTGKMKDGKELYNKWFAGYFPYKNPRYALVAVNLEVPEDSGGINPLFHKMVMEVYRHDQNKND